MNSRNQNHNNHRGNNYDNNYDHHNYNNNQLSNQHHRQFNYDNYQQTPQNFNYHSQPSMNQMSYAGGSMNQVRGLGNNVEFMTPCPLGSRCDRKVYCPLTHPVPEVPQPQPRGQQGNGGVQTFLAPVWRGNPLQ